MSTTATRTPEAVPIERAPTPVPVEPGIAMPPDTLGYQLKRRLLGPPLRNEQLEEERLGKPTALAVFASDNLSSSAYATEEILRVLVPAVGVAAFSLVVPITLAMLGVLAVLILSYRQTIVLVPVMVVFLVRLSRQYETEDAQLEDNVPEAIAAPSSAAISCSCSSTGWTWPPPAPSSTRAPSCPTTCAPSTSRSTSSEPTS
jgi:hypothetical protein